VILAISISPDSRPDFGNAPDQTNQTQSLGIGLINRDQARSIRIRPNQTQEPNFGNAPNFGDDLLRSEN
jgi:hypothetical protein